MAEHRNWGIGFGEQTWPGEFQHAGAPPWLCNHAQDGGTRRAASVSFTPSIHPRASHEALLRRIRGYGPP